MKKIVPFKKDIMFGTGLAEITSISLEHTLRPESSNVFSGEFVISGDYKITEPSINVDLFNHHLPFTIDIDEIYDATNASIDIDDFYYEIINNNILRVHIDVSVDNLEDAPIEVETFEEELDRIVEEAEMPAVELPVVEMPLETVLDDEVIETREFEEPVLEKIIEKREFEEPILDKIENLAHDAVDVAFDIVENVVDVVEETAKGTTNLVKSLFDKIDDSDETYSTYHVYIVREGDSIEHITAKYGVTHEELSLYNDLSDFKIGDKVIVPSTHASNQ